MRVNFLRKKNKKDVYSFVLPSEHDLDRSCYFIEVFQLEDKMQIFCFVNSGYVLTIFFFFFFFLKVGGI